MGAKDAWKTQAAGANGGSLRARLSLAQAEFGAVSVPRLARSCKGRGTTPRPAHQSNVSLQYRNRECIECHRHGMVSGWTACGWSLRPSPPEQGDEERGCWSSRARKMRFFRASTRVCCQLQRVAAYLGFLLEDLYPLLVGEHDVELPVSLCGPKRDKGFLC